MTINKPISQIELEPGSKISISGVNWAEFESIMEELVENRRTRIAYSQGTLEIMSPLPLHERPNRLIGYIVTALLDTQERDWEDFGSTTFRREEMGAGIEPDTCFYIQNALQVRDCDRMDLSIYPPPDLAIETDVTSKTTLNAYLALGIPEVWVYSNGRLTINLLQGGNYQESNLSLIFPELPLREWIPLLVAESLNYGSALVLRKFKQQIAQTSALSQLKLNLS